MLLYDRDDIVFYEFPDSISNKDLLLCEEGIGIIVIDSAVLHRMTQVGRMEKALYRKNDTGPALGGFAKELKKKGGESQGNGALTPATGGSRRGKAG
jgi:hypothetical protein